jgi:hypothetical protein
MMKGQAPNQTSEGRKEGGGKLPYLCVATLWLMEE